VRGASESSHIFKVFFWRQSGCVKGLSFCLTRIWTDFPRRREHGIGLKRLDGRSKHPGDGSGDRLTDCCLRLLLLSLKGLEPCFLFLCCGGICLCSEHVLLLKQLSLTRLLSLFAQEHVPTGDRASLSGLLERGSLLLTEHPTPSGGELLLKATFLSLSKTQLTRLPALTKLLQLPLLVRGQSHGSRCGDVADTGGETRPCLECHAHGEC